MPLVALALKVTLPMVLAGTEAVQDQMMVAEPLAGTVTEDGEGLPQMAVAPFWPVTDRALGATLVLAVPVVLVSTILTVTGSPF